MALSRDSSMFGFDRRAARVTWTVVLVLTLLCMVYLAREALFILVLAVFFAYLVYPGVLLLQRIAPLLSRTGAVTLVFVVLIACLTLLGISLGGRVSEQATALGQKLPELLNDPHATERIPLPQWMEPLRVWIIDGARAQLRGGEGVKPFAQRIATGVLRVIGDLIYLIIIPILAFLLVKDGPHLRDNALAWMKPGPRRAVYQAIVEDLNTLLARYIRALLLLAIAVFCAYGLFFSIVDVPYGLFIAAVAAPLEFIPFVGPLAAAALAVLVAGFSGYSHVLWIVGFIALYRVFQDYALSPYLMSEGVEVHPLIVIVGILAGEQIGGVAGMFIAIPLLAAAKIVAQRIRAAT